MGCKEPSLHVSVSLVDLVALSLISGEKATELFRRDVKIGFDPDHENEPWIGQISLELKKPCPFLDGKKCSVYPGRPVACVLFPESYFIVERPERILQENIFQNFPCIQEPCRFPLGERQPFNSFLKFLPKRFVSPISICSGSHLSSSISRISPEKGWREFLLRRNERQPFLTIGLKISFLID